MRPPVLAYHKIDLPTPDVKIRGAFTSPKRFERQMTFLKRRGFEFYTASELVQSYIENGRFPPNAVAITFDDGWKDNYRNAFPVLRSLGVKATIFLVPACIGRTTDLVTAEGEGPREHLSESDIREMSDYGIEFGSHSMNHKLLDRVSPDEVEAEVLDSKKYIEDLLQTDCRSFAYPAGFFTDTAKRCVKNAGYITAFSTVYGAENKLDLFELNRTEILRRDRYPFRFSTKVRSFS